MTTYIARADGWIAGRRVVAGQTVEMTAAQAKYEPVDPLPEPPAKPARAPRQNVPAADKPEAVPE